MDANKKPTASQSGLDAMRAQALRQKQVRFQSQNSEDDSEARCAWQGIKTLKNKVTDELMLESCEQSLLARWWSSFQELLGNK